MKFYHSASAPSGFFSHELASLAAFVAKIRRVEEAEGFDRIYRSIIGSLVYRDAIRASLAGLPDWLVPFSVVDGELLCRIASELGVEQGETLLDLGCGGGGPGLWVAGHIDASLVGVDLAPAAVDAARRLATELEMSQRAQFVVADGTATGMAAGSISGVMSIDALMFIDAETVANEIARVLKPGGVLVATAAESLVDPFSATLVRDYRPVFERAGFEVEIHEELAGHAERQLALYQALDNRADVLRREIGEMAEQLLDEARKGLRHAADQDVRVRHALIVARHP